MRASATPRRVADQLWAVDGEALGFVAMAASVNPEWDFILNWLESEKGCRVAMNNFTRNIEVRCPDCGFQTVVKIRTPQPTREVLDDLAVMGCEVPGNLAAIA